MVNKQPNQEEVEEVVQAPYEFGFIRLKMAAWTPAVDSPIWIGPVVLDLGF